jgi:ABC-2 type transport system permease protein
MKVLAISFTNLRRTFREPVNLFFVFLFPILLILVLGVSFGGAFEPRVGVLATASGPLSTRLVRELNSADGISVEAVDDRETLVSRVEHGELEVGVIVPDEYDEAVMSGVAHVSYLARPSQSSRQVQSIIAGIVSEEAARLRAARFASSELKIDVPSAIVAVDVIERTMPRIAVRTHTIGEAAFPESAGRFDVGASGQLLLFLFVTSMTGAAALIETRRLGISRRMLATPTSSTTIIAGEGLGRLSVAIVQAAFIMLVSGLFFDVSWGDPVAALAIVLAFSLVASGAGMLLGAVPKTPQQSVAVGLLVGLGFAALGGAMMPLEFFSDTMKRVAHVTPHAWASDAFTELVRHGGDLGDVGVELMVLLSAAAGLLLLSSWRLRKAISH